MDIAPSVRDGNPEADAEEATEQQEILEYEDMMALVSGLREGGLEGEVGRDIKSPLNRSAWFL